jgi:hypothetical protein
VKSDEDFAGILAKENPDVWESHKPAEGGAAGKMLRQVIEKAAAIKAGWEASAGTKRTTKRGKVKRPRKQP